MLSGVSHACKIEEQFKMMYIDTIYNYLCGYVKYMYVFAFIIFKQMLLESY